MDLFISDLSMPKEKLCYLSHQKHEASSNDPLSFGVFLLSPV